MKHYFLTLFLLIATFVSFAQQRQAIEGKILDEKTNAPIPFVNVFLESTTTGTQTDQNGNFILKNIPAGNYRLVASMVGYQPFIQNISIAEKTVLLKIVLKTDLKILQEVRVVSSRDKAWEKQFQEFEQEFLGNDFNKKEVKILNREVVDFKSDDHTLTAYASQALEIENRTLGYKITYILQDFQKKKETTSYKGLARYEVLKPKDAKEELAWKRNRVEAYNGSINHFLKALLDDKLEEEGFDAFFLNPTYVNNTLQKPLFYEVSSNRHFGVKPKEIPRQKEGEWTVLQLKYPIEVVYNKQRNSRPVFVDAPHPYSILLPKSLVLVNATGNLLNPYSVEMRGDMGKKSISASLPLDFSIVEEPQKTEVVTQKYTSLREKLSAIDDQKIYLHTDKSAYFASDTLWYKAYITDAQTNKLMSVPQKFFVELFSSKNTSQPIIKQTLKTENNGVAWSSILLPDSLQTGAYVLKAYTNWMRNNEQAIVFQKEIFVKKISRFSNSKNTLTDSQLEVQFFPEGGQYIWGIPAKIGVKVSNNRGKSIVGQIVDSKGHNISEFSTNILGIGSFMLENQRNNHAKVLINGIEFQLPKPQEDGFVLQVDNNTTNSFITANVWVSPNRANESMSVLLQSKGIVYQETRHNLNANHLQLKIDKQHLSAGIYQLTIFDKNQLPQAERLLFIKSNDKPVNIDISHSIDRRSVALNLQLLGIDKAISGEFSMSVADASQVASFKNAENLYTYFLLSSELSGKIENPNYYFLDDSPERTKALDDLLLTQGWRRYKWEDILKNPAKIERKHQHFEPLNIKGVVFSADKNHRPLSDTNLMILPLDATQKPFFTKTDKNGRFLIENLSFADSTGFVVKVTNAKGKELRTTIELEKEEGFKANFDTKSTYLLDETYLKEGIARISNEYQEKDAVKDLEEVMVTAKSDIDYEHNADGSKVWKLYDKPDGMIKVNERTNGTNVIQIIQRQIPALKIRGDGVSQKYTYYGRGRATLTNNADTVSNDEPPLFLLDGVVVPAPRDQSDFLMSIAPQDIDRVDYLVNAAASMYGSRGTNGVIAVYTRTGSKNTFIFNSKLQSIRLRGFEAYREFYVPNANFDTESAKDVRDILLWKPSFELQTNNLKTIHFYNNEATTKVLIVIEGILNNGEPFSKKEIVELKTVK